MSENTAWRPINTAPKDGTKIIVYCPSLHGLPCMTSICAWHEDAGFCVDELRSPSLWTSLPRAHRETNGFNSDEIPTSAPKYQGRTSNTPETGAVAFPETLTEIEVVGAEFARKMERERNKWCDLASLYAAEREHNANLAEQYKAERDKALQRQKIAHDAAVELLKERSMANKELEDQRNATEDWKLAEKWRKSSKDRVETIEELRAQRDTVSKLLAAESRDAKRLGERLVEAIDALNFADKYLEHLPSCNLDSNECTCGLDEAMRKIESVKEK